MTTRNANQLAFLLSKCQSSKRWISNYRDRANIRINLAFHLSTQLDNDTNLEISKATTALAEEARKDSSSMITIAAVTMFFLPGTFVSAVFSMTFFSFQSDENGKEVFAVSQRWWWFLCATVPLTAGVFGVWVLWQKIRARNSKILEDIWHREQEDANGIGYSEGYNGTSSYVHSGSDSMRS